MAAEQMDNDDVFGASEGEEFGELLRYTAGGFIGGMVLAGLLVTSSPGTRSFR